MTSFKKIMLYFLIVIGILGIINTIIIARISVGITLGVILPGMIGVILIAFSIINLLKKRAIFSKIWLKNTLIIILCIGFALFATVELFIISNAYTKKDATAEANFVVVLGCGIFEDGRLTLTLTRRLNVALDFLQNHPYSVCIVSGGQGPNEPYPEAQAMGEYLIDNGISEDRVLYENRSTSTRENLLFSAQVIAENYPCMPQTLMVVSSEFHMFRVKFLAMRYGMQASGLASHTSWYLLPNTYLREFFAVIKSFLLD